MKIAVVGPAYPFRGGSAVLKLALGSGVPVVATRTGGMDEAVEDGVTGFLVEPGDVAGLSRALVQYFRDDCAPSFRRAIEQTQARFGWQTLIDVIVT